MITLITAALSFLGSFIPDGLKLLQDKRDKEHELAVMNLQMTMQEKGINAKFDEVAEQSYATQMNAIQESYRKELELSGKIMSIYSASVRPTITYLMFSLYAAVKIAAICVALASNTTWVLPILAIWTVFDEALLGAVFGFWFGSRVKR